MKKLLGLGTKLLVLVGGALILLTIILAAFTTDNLRTNMDEQVENGLHNVVYSLQSFYEESYKGDYVMSEDGAVSKGEFMITDNYTLIDGIKKELLTDVTFFYGDTRVATTVKNETGERAIGTKASDVVINEVLKNGNIYFDTKVQVNGVPYYGYYLPLKNSDGSVAGMIFAGKASEEVSEEIKESVKKNVTLAFWVLLCAILVTIIFVVNLSRVIKNVKSALAEVSEGNLKAPLTKRALKRKDELGDIARAVYAMQNDLLHIVTKIKDTSGELSVSAKRMETNSESTVESIENINTTMLEIAKGAGEQAEETQTSAQNISSMGNLIHLEMESVKELMLSADKMKKAEADAANYIKNLVATNDNTLYAVQRIEERTNATNQSVQEIRQAVDVITSIAKETNLLSLNASIEAARAGEHGKGFAVVAQQIQKLSEESNRSAKEIEVVIGSLSKESEQSILAMEEVKKSMGRQSEDLQNTKEKFDAMREGIDTSSNHIQMVETQSAQIDDYRSIVVEALQNLAAISQENAASTEETTASIEEVNAIMEEFSDSAKGLNEMAESLEHQIRKFQI